MASVLRSTVRWTLSSLSARGVARWRPLSSETTGSVVKTGTSEEVVEYVSPDELVSILYTNPNSSQRLWTWSQTTIRLIVLEG